MKKSTSTTLLWVGGLALVGGGVFFFMKSKEKEAIVAPAPAPVSTRPPQGGNDTLDSVNGIVGGVRDLISFL